MSGEPLRILDLFSGIGGFSLGLERACGFKTVAFCEIESFCRRVLAKHWPNVPCYDDVRTLTADRLAADGIAVDVICGGFPCQDISLAGRGAGLAGERSGLWREYARLVGELRPLYVIVENVSALLSRGLGDVLGDLVTLGYDAEWHCIPASAVGAPHRRDRVWIVAYAGGEQHEGRSAEISRALAAELFGSCLANTNSGRRQTRDRNLSTSGHGHPTSAGCCHVVAVRDADCSGLALGQGERGDYGEECTPTVGTGWWFTEPDVGRVANGVPARVDRLKGLGNAVVPPIPEIIGRAIYASRAAL